MKEIAVIGLLAALPFLLSGPALADSPAQVSVQSAPPPAYPEAARLAGLEGTTRLRLTVTAEGLPEGIKVYKSSGHSILDEAALTAVQQWRFKPARDENGTALANPVIVPVTFSLSGSPSILTQSCQSVLDQVAQVRATAPDTKLGDMFIFRQTGGLAISLLIAEKPTMDLLAFSKNLPAFHEALLASCDAKPEEQYLKVLLAQLKISLAPKHP